jgi:hypothetical protein
MTPIDCSVFLRLKNAPGSRLGAADLGLQSAIPSIIHPLSFENSKLLGQTRAINPSSPIAGLVREGGVLFIDRIVKHCSSVV